MLGKLSRFASPKIERLLKQLEVDETSYDIELRKSARWKLVMPVTVSSTESDCRVRAFSRDVSSGGFSLISHQPFSSGMEMNLELNLDKLLWQSTVECRWNQKFGVKYWVSGWKLTDVQLDVEVVREAELMIASDKRSNHRERYAVPVIVHQKRDLPRVHAFTRNLSGSGVNLVTNKEVPINSFCKLEFFRSNGEECKIISECMWSKKYGKDHWMTGWEFPRLSRIADFHAPSFED
jgi:hypothetical protein